MTKAYDSVIAEIDRYITVMTARGKPPEVVYVTRDQFNTLRGNNDNDNFRPRYKGVEIRRKP